MRWKKIVGGIFLILGAASYFLGAYIEGEVALGREKVKDAEKSVKQGEKLLEAIPYTKGLSGTLTDPVQKKIEAGKKEIQQYQDWADELRDGGAILFILGAGFMTWGLIRSKKR